MTLVAELHAAGPMKPLAGSGNLGKDIMCRDFRLYRTAWTYSKGGLERIGRVGLANVVSSWFYHYSYNCFYKLVRKEL